MQCENYVLSQWAARVAPLSPQDLQDARSRGAERNWTGQRQPSAFA